MIQQTFRIQPALIIILALASTTTTTTVIYHNSWAVLRFIHLKRHQYQATVRIIITIITLMDAQILIMKVLQFIKRLILSRLKPLMIWECMLICIVIMIHNQYFSVYSNNQKNDPECQNISNLHKKSSIFQNLISSYISLPYFDLPSLSSTYFGPFFNKQPFFLWFLLLKILFSSLFSAFSHHIFSNLISSIFFPAPV